MVTLSNMWWVPSGELPTEKLKNELTVRSCYEDVPPIKTYKEQDGYFGIPRNYTQFVETEFKDERTTGKSINIEFNGQLRQQQDYVIKKWLEYYNSGATDTILNCPTGAGKTILALKIAAILKVPFLVIVPREGLMGQWATKILEFTNIKNGQIGYIQQTTCDYENKSACVGMIHSICKDHYSEEFKKHFGLVIWDEVHLVSAQTFSETAGMFPAKYRMGLSATLERSDKMQDVAFHHLGQNIIAPQKSYQPKPTVGVYKYRGISTRFPHWITTKIQKRAWLLSTLASDTERNKLIAYFAHVLIQKGLRTLVIGERIKQLEEIRYYLYHEYDEANTGVYISNVKKETKEHLLENADCLLATTKMLDVGIDKDTLRGLIFATPLSDVRQVVGRIRRINNSVPDPIVIDIVDKSHKQPQWWAEKRREWYEEENFKVVNIDV